MQKKKDSRELLRESVIELVGSMPVEKVSVGMICENCGLSTRTFYNYFKDKHDLIAWVYTSVIDQVYDGRKDASEVSFHTAIDALVHDIVENSAFYMSAVHFTGQNCFMNSVFRPLRESSIRYIRDVCGDPVTEELSEAVDFYIFGCLGFMQHHLLKRDVVPADRTIRIFENNIPGVLRKYLGGGQGDKKRAQGT